MDKANLEEDMEGEMQQEDRPGSTFGDLPFIKSGRSNSLFSASVYRPRKESIPGDVVNKRATVAKEVEMPFRKPKTLYENMIDFSMVTNIHGTYYVFEQDVNKLSRLFWLVTWLMLFGFSLYMISIAYISWAENPVLTTASTTALPIEQVEFPVITICGQGTITETVEIAYLRQVVRYLSKKGIEINVSRAMTADELLSKHGYDFIHEHYPGALLSPVEMVATMTSQNPNQHIRAQIAVAGGYDACEDMSYKNLSALSNNTRYAVTESLMAHKCNNLLYDPEEKTCYEYSNKATELEDAYNVCWNKLGFIMYPHSDRQFLGIKKLIEKGSLKVLKSGTPIWLDLRRSKDGSFRLLDGRRITNSTFHFLNLTNTNINDPTKQCFVMYYSEEFKLFIGKQASCSHAYPSLCYSLLEEEPNCTDPQTIKKQMMLRGSNDKKLQVNLLDRLINPKTLADINKDVAHKKKNYYKAFHSLKIGRAYRSLFELLWYSQLPCFDVNGFFDRPNQRSLLKQCKWKGINIPCSAIFKTVPTDRGMCCTFNMKAAEDIFYKSRYQTMVSQLQKDDQENSYTYSGLPEWYEQASEPTSQQGVNRGLSITVDAHTDQIGSSTVNEDYQGFIAMINSRNSYPISKQSNIRIKPGHDTLVAISAIDVQADLKYMDVKDRKCYYPKGVEEEEIMIMHNNYSQASCVLECQIIYAMEKMTQVGEEPCIPWYLPSLTKDAKMCNPWSTIAFREQIDLIPNGQCTYCLTDCQSTIYKHHLSSAPFRRCDNKNLGISNFCNLDDHSLPEPRIFAKQVLREFEGLQELPDYVKKVQTSERFFSPPNSFDDVFQKSNEKVEDVRYDAYDKDIAVVHFYFETPTIFQYSRQPKMSWIDFVSQVGGLLGLCLGFSICMGVELLYWGFCRMWVDVKTNTE